MNCLTKLALAGTLLLGSVLPVQGATVLLDPTTLAPGPIGVFAPQGWLLGFSGSDHTQTAIPGQGIVLDSTATRSDQAGLFSDIFIGPSHFENPNVPALDRHAGFRLSFALEVRQESHSLLRDDNGDGRLDRAGFSVIVISEDLEGLEIAFFEDKVWVYEDALAGTDSAFTQAESALIDTTGGVIEYELTVLGDAYTLYADDGLLLTGELRNYVAGGAGPADVYGTPSFLFFGDDTSSAESEVLLGRIEVAPVPLPGAVVLMLGALGPLGWVAVRRRGGLE